MNGLKRWEKVCVGIAVGLFVMGAFGLSGPGQTLLRRDAPGAGLAPLYCFLPGVLLVGYVTISVSWTRFREAQKASKDGVRKKNG